jgi:hypothetical protein
MLVSIYILEDLTASMMEAISSSETSVSTYHTIWCNVSEDSHLHTYCGENRKSH